MNMRLKKKVKKKLLNILLIILISCFCYSIYNIFILTRDKNNNTKLINKIQNEVIDSSDLDLNTEEDENNYLDNLNLELDFEKLNKINSDTVAWITVNGTHINYPIVQTKDNDYYLKHSFDKSLNVNGWIFLNYANSSSFDDQNTIIFGHNTNGNTMFSELKDIYNGKMGNDINIIIYLKDKTLFYKVFSIYLTSEHDSTSLSNYLDEETINNFITKSKIDFNTSVSENDYILTLSTCYKTSEKKIILNAKMVSE
jgi:sortase B